jgi:CHAT domain-containing protein
MRKTFTFLFLSYNLLAIAQQDLLDHADSQYKNAQYDQAFESYQKAAEQFKTISAEQYASCNLKMGNCLLKTGANELAITQANNTQQYILAENIENQSLQIASLQIIGEGQLKMGRNDLALETLLLAEAKLGQEESLLAAECYNNLGVIYWNNANKETALGYHDKALTIRKRLLPANDVLLADSYLNIGLIHLDDDFLKSVINFNNALKIYQEAYGKNHPQVALCYSNLAFANSAQSNYEEALGYLEITLSIWDSNFAGNHPNKAFTKSNMGRILSAQGNYAKALVLHEEALRQYITLYGEKHPEVANTYSLIGSVQIEQKQYAHAVESFQRSIFSNLFDQSFETIYDQPKLDGFFSGDILLSSMQSKAQALEALHFEKSLAPKDIKCALETYLLCDDLISQIRQRRLTEGDKIRIGKLASEIYESGIRTSLYLADKTFKRKYYTELAFTFCERSKSAVLLEAISETKAKSFAGIPDELLAQEDSLKNKMSYLEQQLASNKEESRTKQLESELFELRQAYRLFVNHLEQDYPSYFNLKYRQQDISVASLQAKLNDYTAIVSYFIGEESIYIFTITADELTALVKPKDAELLKLAKGFINGIKYHIPTAYEAAAEKLHAQLIPKLGKMIQYVVIIPDGLLGTIPFEALATRNDEGKLEYLLEKYAISYDYAGSLLLDKLDLKSGNGKGILLTAPVSFEKNDLKMATLPGSADEVREIKYLFIGSEDMPTIRTQADASETMFKSADISSYKYLHLATHGIVHESKPELSRIFLSPDATEDGSLYSGEIFGLSINADLVALSACETGLGKIEKGEGIIGLSRSLMYAGAKNMMVSLWQVSDASTSELMIEFYRQHLHHSTNMKFADDLRKAKLGLLKGDTYQDPYYWAPFVLIGL